MKHRMVVVGAILFLLPFSPKAEAVPGAVVPEVAVAPFAVEQDSAGVLRAVADSCLARLVGGLTAKGIVVARHRELSERNLRSARPAHWAVLGELTREKGQFHAELRLLEVESGDEMRSYFNVDQDPAAIVEMGRAAAGRIATFVEEHRGA